jgi:hypothetical protein
MRVKQDFTRVACNSLPVLSRADGPKRQQHRSCFRKLRVDRSTSYANMAIIEENAFGGTPRGTCDRCCASDEGRYTPKSRRGCPGTIWSFGATSWWLLSCVRMMAVFERAGQGNGLSGSDRQNHANCQIVSVYCHRLARNPPFP